MNKYNDLYVHHESGNASDRWLRWISTGSTTGRAPQVDGKWTKGIRGIRLLPVVHPKLKLAEIVKVDPDSVFFPSWEPS